MGSQITVKRLYKILLSHYGSQYWWPVYFGKQRDNEQGLSQSQLEIILGAILTQNTAWQNVRKALANLNQKGLIDWDKLVRVSNKRLAQLIRPAGYFNQKAGYIKNILQALQSKNFRKLSSFSKLRQFLLGIKGIGEETCDSILLYAFGKSVFVVDAYTKRLFERLNLVPLGTSYSKIQNLVHQKFTSYPERVKIYQEFHALIVKQAKIFCQNKPLCKNCILRRWCNKKSKVKSQNNKLL